jgi:hypothetical protein
MTVYGYVPLRTCINITLGQKLKVKYVNAIALFIVCSLKKNWIKYETTIPV